MGLSKAGTWLRVRCGRRRVAVVSGLLFAVSQGVIAYTIRDLPPEKLVVLQTTFSKMTFLSILGAWKMAGVLPQFKAHFYFDFFHPVWYGVFLASLMALSFNANAVPGRLNGLLLIPVAAAILDLVENIVDLSLMLDIRRVTDTTVFLGALAANLKWALAGAGVLIVVILMARWGFRRIFL